MARPAYTLHLTTQGERAVTPEIDERCAATTNERPQPTPAEAASRNWTPDAGTWDAIRQHGAQRTAFVSFASAHSRGRVGIRISKDPVGAPIFYRDVPLMPEEAEKGVIKPLGSSALPLIAWRLRNVGRERSSRATVARHPTVRQLPFFQWRMARFLAMDLDGPQNDKGLYAIAPIHPQTSIRNEDVIEWGAFREKAAEQSRVGFMSQISPDGRYVVTDRQSRGSYVANFKDYRFLQVFYPTRGILAWYDRDTRRMHTLPGADDPHYVQTSAFWSPDGKYLVFARAEAEMPIHPACGRPNPPTTCTRRGSSTTCTASPSTTDAAGGRKPLPAPRATG